MDRMLIVEVYPSIDPTIKLEDFRIYDHCPYALAPAFRGGVVGAVDCRLRTSCGAAGQ